MAIYEIDGQRYEVPDEVQGAQLKETLTQLSEAQQPTEQAVGQITDPLGIPGQFDEKPTPQPLSGQQQPISQTGQAILDIPGGAAVSEFASAVNRGAINILDFVGPEQINNALQLMGSESRVPTLAEQPFIQEATIGQFMEPGLAREAVRTAGEFVAPAGVGGQVLRTAAAQVPKIAPTVTQRVIQASAGAPGQELTGAVLAGAGSEIGEEIGEAIGGEEGKQVGRMIGGIGLPVAATLAKESVKLLTTSGAKSLLNEAAPTIEGLKQASREVYRAIDDLGVTINSSSVTRLSKQLGELTKKQGFNSTIHPKVNAALKEFEGVAGSNQTLSEIDTLRRIAKAASGSIEPDEARLGRLMTDKVDDFLDNLNRANFSGAYKKDVGAKYKDARQLWARARKAEIIEDAFNRARLQASGFENGIRTQFRSILNNKKKSRGFTKEELNAMRGVVKGGTMQNMAKMIGRFGFNEGQASNMLMGSLGVAGGAVIGGPAGAVAVPLIGSVSRNLAQKLTRKAAEGSDLIVRAGRDGLDVAKAYIKLTTPSERSAKELTELLLRPGISLESLRKAAQKMPPIRKKLINDAVFLTTAIKTAQEED